MKISFIHSVSIMVAASSFSTISSGADRVTGAHFATRSEIVAPTAMVATSHPLATQIALDIMKKGGNAVDAAIGANAALGLMEPTGNSMGGDLFALVWDPKTEKLHGLNASGRAPAKLSIDEIRKRGLNSIPKYGPLPVSVPGCVDGWFELHAKFGKTSIKDIFAPTIAYARNGHPVSQTVAYYWNKSVPRLEQFPGFKEQYTVNGRAPAEGELWKNPNLADTLEKLSNGGRDAFYSGGIAHTIANYIQEQGGLLTWEDMSSHKSEWVEPISSNYRGVDVWELPPNTQGVAALQILNILERYDIQKMGFGSADYVHTFVEAKKLAFADRAKYYADPAFSEAPLAGLVSKEYAANRQKLISPSKAAASVDAGNPALRHGDTIYLTTADESGMMVSLIQSNYRGMGSGMTPPGLGFILQDRAELFSLDPTHANALQGGKRPFHTIIPAFATKDGKPWMSFGVMGGDMQPQGHAQIIVNMIDFGMNLQEAGDAPRIYHTGSSEPTGSTMNDGGILSLEKGYSASVRDELIKRGHVFGETPGAFGGYQAIMRDGNVYRGASESRKDGQAAGY